MFEDGPFEDVRPFSVFTQLTVLKLNVGAATDLSSLGQLRGLKTLGIDGGEKSSWEWLGELRDLETLGLSPSDYENGGAHRIDLSGNPKLSELSWYGGSGDLTPLARAPKLETLKLGGAIVDLAPLQALGALSELDISGEVRDLSPLLGLKSLYSLSLRGNRIRSLEGIETLPELGSLDVDSNCIGDFSPVRLWLKDEDEANEWIRLTARSQFDLSSPAGQAAHEDWDNAEKWLALAVHFESLADPRGAQLRQYLETGECAEEDWFENHEVPVLRRL